MGLFDDLPDERAAQPSAGLFTDLPPEAPQDGGDMARGLGLTGRAALQGVGDVLDFAAAPVRGALNLLPGVNIQGRTGEAVADVFGLPKPATSGERLGEAVGESMLAGALPMAAGAKLGQTATTVLQKNLAKMLAANPRLQTALNALAGGAGQVAEDAGAGAAGQLAAATLAPMGAVAVAKPLAMGVRRMGEITHPMLTERGTERAAARIAADVAGERAPQVADALVTGSPVLTAGQAASRVGSAEMPGLERLVASYEPSIYGPHGVVPVQQEQTFKALRGALNQATGPAREAALTQANAAGTLNVAPLSMDLAALRADPNLSNKTAQTMLGWVDKELVRIADPGTGEVNARALYNLRKDIGLKLKEWQGSPKWDKNTASGLLADIQRKIDWELDNTLGTTQWSEGYIAPHAAGAKRISELEAVPQRASEMGAAGAAKARQIARLDEASVHLPNMLERSVMLINSLLRAGQGYGGERTTLKLADLMQPQNKAALGQLIGEELRRREGRVTFGEAMRKAGQAGMYNEAFD